MTPRSSGLSEVEAVGESAPLYQLGYVSTQTRAMKGADLIRLLNFARDENKKAGISGLLLHRQDSFFQVIEGSEENVNALFKRIQADKRHQKIEVLFQGATQSREFPDWQMGFLDLDDVDVSLLPGFSNFLFDDAEPRRFLRELTRGKRLALLFRVMN